MYESPLAGRRTLAITGHPSKAVGKGLSIKMINILDGDVETWKAELDRQEREKKRLKGNGHG